MGPTVLVVDDNKAVRQFCQSELEAVGLQVLTAEDGQRALSMLRMQMPDVVVLDVNMPAENGLHVARRLHALYPDLPVIFHTSSRSIAGSEQWVIKSADVRPLVNAIWHALQRWGCTSDIAASRSGSSATELVRGGEGTC